MDLGLAGRTVIVTGGTSGIGVEICRTFAAEGADLVLTFHERREPAEDLAAEIVARYAVSVEVVSHHLGDLESAREIVTTAVGMSGRVDVLVNNAVRFGARASRTDPFESVADDEWRPMVRANVEGAVHLSRLVAPMMRDQGWGRFVHMGSGVAAHGMAGNEYYAAAKAALVGFSRSLAMSMGAAGDILSNVVEAGFTRTDRNEGTGLRIEAAIVEQTPIRRLVAAPEIARVVTFLGSEANTAMTGQVVPVAGGQ